MTAQPTTPISTPQFPPPAPQQGPAPAYGPPQPPYGAGPVPPGYPPLPPAPKRSTGKIVGIVAAVLVLLGGLGAAALFVFGPRSVEPESVQQEIVRITQTAVGVVPADVRCPAEIRAQAGGTFACTATVDGQPVTYDVRQDDDQGNLTITYDRLLKVAEVEGVIAQQVGTDVEVAVNVECPPGGSHSDRQRARHADRLHGDQRHGPVGQRRDQRDGRRRRHAVLHVRLIP